MKVISEIKKMTAKALKKAQSEHDEAMCALEKAKSENNMLHWLEWNPPRLAKACLTLWHWKRFAECLNKVVAEKKSDKQVVEWIEGFREGIVEDIMRGRSPSSTSRMANLLSDLSLDVSREFAGTGICSFGSLAEIIATWKGKVKE